tara:strand:+ start:803 stop:922 length:120 start_codon:yes stop_codon:yes gene_type:complete
MKLKLQNISPPLSIFEKDITRLMPMCKQLKLMNDDKKVW